MLWFAGLHQHPPRWAVAAGPVISVAALTALGSICGMLLLPALATGLAVLGDDARRSRPVRSFLTGLPGLVRAGFRLQLIMLVAVGVAVADLRYAATQPAGPIGAAAGAAGVALLLLVALLLPGAVIALAAGCRTVPEQLTRARLIVGRSPGGCLALAGAAAGAVLTGGVSWLLPIAGIAAGPFLIRRLPAGGAERVRVRGHGR